MTLRSECLDEARIWDVSSLLEREITNASGEVQPCLMFSGPFDIDGERVACLDNSRRGWYSDTFVDDNSRF